jgi:hypothetical protein
MAVPQSILRGVWCPVCGRKAAADAQRETLADMQKLASIKGGKCVSTKYENALQKLSWACKRGHQWYALPNSIKQGHWCPTCSNSGKGAKKTIEHFKTIAQARGGECLSESYDGIFLKLRWRFSQGHEWEAPAKSVQDGRWCAVCGRRNVGEKLKKTISDMQKLAEMNGGECLSSVYQDAKTNLKWRCAKGHEWFSAPTTISSGSWCSYCRRREAWDRRRDQRSSSKGHSHKDA